MEVRKLTCPSCGAQVDISADLSRALCLYCGSTLVVERTDEAEGEAIETHLELGRITFEARNPQEALQHCNEVLEADPNNANAWVGKAIATHNLSVRAGTDDRLDEALHYIDKALELNPQMVEARRIREDLKRNSSVLLNHLGNEAMKLAVKKEQSARHVRKALEYYHRVIALNPRDPQYLKNVAYVLSHEPGGREYGDPIPYERAARFLEEREGIRTELVALREELSELEQQKQRGGFGLLDRRRGQYSRVNKRIAELESLIEVAAALGIDTQI